jgi:hypothetical protein
MIEDLKLTLEERRARVRELRQYMDEQVTETQMMQECIAVLSRENATAAQRQLALQELQPLVEPIDNANGASPQTFSCQDSTAPLSLSTLAPLSLHHSSSC